LADQAEAAGLSSSVEGPTKKAGDRTRTDDIQLGKLNVIEGEELGSVGGVGGLG
jgi:hypothetical protein